MIPSNIIYEKPGFSEQKGISFDYNSSAVSYLHLDIAFVVLYGTIRWSRLASELSYSKWKTNMSEI